MSQMEGFISHLVELRQRIVRAAQVYLLVAIPLFAIWHKEVYDLLAQPLIQALPQGTKLIATGVVSPFLVPLKVSLLVAFLITLPHSLYQAWAFIAPGLYQHEKRLALPLIISSTLLFFVGMAFAYFVAFPVVFSLLPKLAPDSVTFAPDIQNYLDFVLWMFVAFGLTFETPVVVVLLVTSGILRSQQLRDWRPYIIVGAFVVAAIATPPDIASQLLLAIPLCILFEVGLLVATWMEKRKAATRAAS